MKRAVLLQQPAMTPKRKALLPFAVPIAAALLLFGLAWTPRVSQNNALMASFFAAAGVLAVWSVMLALRMRRKHESPDVVLILRRQHYIQACLQLLLYAYWGWYWRAVYDYGFLLLAQIVFGVGFDALLNWSRGRRAVLGFGIMPIILSTNVFIWFKDDWYVFQFAMIALGYMGKGLITWERDGQKTHIFNPSGFALSVVSIILITTGNTGMTWGVEIAETLFRPPNIYVLIFLLGVVVQALFSVTAMTLAAVSVVFGFGAIYALVTGAYFYIDTGIPIAVFLGMFLLVTDPSTSPKTEAGRLVFGAMYGVTVLFFYWLLERFGMPSFYDKLLGIPLCNLSVQALDKWARSLQWKKVKASPAFQRLTAHVNSWEMGVLAVLFGLMIGTGFIGDDNHGNSIAHWRAECAKAGEGSKPCEALERLVNGACVAGSGWACNELASVYRGLGMTDKSKSLFARACLKGFEAGCANRELAEDDMPQRAQPMPEDWALILQEGKGPLPSMSAPELAELACERGWVEGCREIAVLYSQGLAGAPVDAGRALGGLRRGCELDDPASCVTLAVRYDTGDGVPASRERAFEFMRRACDLGTSEACEAIAQASAKPATELPGDEAPTLSNTVE